MSKTTKTEAGQTVTVTDADPSQTVTFVDTAYMSRIVVLPDGRTFPVFKSQITSSDPALIEHLDADPEFKRTEA